MPRPPAGPTDPPEDVVAVVAASPLFDAEWYAAQTGRTFADKSAAAAAYVAGARSSGATPHPLVEPAWLYPGGRWRRTSPDPLSFLLTEDGRDRGTHPLLGEGARAWLETAAPDDVAPTRFGAEVTLRRLRAAAWSSLTADDQPQADAPDATLVIASPGRFQRTFPWLRQAWRWQAGTGRTLEVLVVADDPETRRMALVTGAAVPGVRVLNHGGSVTDRLAAGLDAARAPLAVLVDDRLDPPLWPWLHHLTDRLDADPSAVATTALLVEADQTVVAAGAVVTGGAPAPFLRGATPDDVVRAAALPLPAAWPGVVAVRTPAARAVGGLGAGPTDLTVRLAAARAGGQRHGSTYVVPDARVVVPPEAAPELLAPPPVPVAPPPPHPDLLATAGYRAPGEPLRVREGVPALRWALDIAAPVAPRGRRWGDDPFARSLGAALERLGQWVTIDHPETRGRASRADDDVVLVLRGLDAVPVREDGPVHALWVISHPDEVTAAEVAGHDVVLAASPTWAAERSRAWGRPVEPLLQCTDAARFHPGLAEPDTGPAVLFVGNSRNAARPAVDLALAAGLPLTVYGDGWSGVLPPEVLAGISVPNDRLGALYAAAGVVLGDHWADMRARGFVSNRVFDVLACGGRLLSDDVAGLSDLFGDAVAVWRTPEEFADLVAGDPRRAFPGVEERAALAGKVVREHSFDARARHLVDALVPRALARRDRP